jgi:hypothetical protein
MEDAVVMKRMMVFDQPQRVLDATKAGLGLAFPRSYPKPVNLSTCR